MLHVPIMETSQHIADPNELNPIINVTNTQLQKLLELLCHTNDIDVLIKIFTTLGVYLLSNGTYSDQIIKCNLLYEKILLVMNKGIQTKTKMALNLISAIMYIDSKEGHTRKKALYFHSQNLIRTSGCLTAMSGLFANSMMQRETWRSLCQSLSEACCKSTINQNNCSHLVPMCIRRCQQGDIDALSVLKSLLNRHERNLDIFYHNNGLSMFTRETLQYSNYLEVLNTILENSKLKHKKIIAKADDIFDHIRYILFSYGNNSTIGQWISIILYSRRKLLGLSSNADNEKLNDNVHETNSIQENNRAQDVSTPLYRRNDVHSETATLIKNVLMEVMDYQTTNKIKSKPMTFENNLNWKTSNHCGTFNKTPMSRKITPRTRGTPRVAYQRANIKSDTNLSFSFLFNKNNASVSKSRCFVSVASRDNNSTDVVKSLRDVSNNRTVKATLQRDDIWIDFNPPFVSTPLKNKSISNVTRNTFTRVSSFSETLEKQTNVTNIIPQQKTNVKNRSIGSRFFNIINGSCSTILQGFSKFKNVFKNKRLDIKVSDDMKNKSSVRGVTNNNCSYSFTNYMRKRDAFYANVSRKNKMLRKNEFSCNTNNNYSSCRTCNDTVMLQRKLAGDPELRECMRKLKLGINLYGCDFKKISRTFWARETYMTPEVLYTLYRKLIDK